MTGYDVIRVVASRRVAGWRGDGSPCGCPGAEERTARAKRENLAAEQQLLVAAQHRSTAQDLQSRADEIDPDID